MATFTDITILLDRSGSMENIKSAMESAFSEFIRQHKSVPTTRLTLMQFDSQEPIPEVVYAAQPIGDAKPFVIEPRDMTPLLDALCRGIDRTGARLGQMADVERPDQVLFVIITDGLENASREFKRSDARARIEHQRAAYKWQFVYLGANQDALREAASIGIATADAIDYAAVPACADAVVASLTSNSVNYANRKSARAGAFTGAQRSASIRPKTAK